MLTSRRVLLQDIRSAAKLACHNNKCVFEHPTLVKVGEQPGDRLIQTRQTESHTVRTVAERVAHAHVSAVHIPTATRWALFVVLGLSGPAVDSDKADARFHHASGEQQILPQWMHSIAFANLVWLLAKIKRLPAFGSRQRFVGLLAQV